MKPTKGESIDAHEGGGATRSSDEVSVMEMERRGWIIQPHSLGQPEMGGTSRMWQSRKVSARMIRAVWIERFKHGSVGNGFMIHTSVRYWKLSVFCFGFSANGRLGNLEWAAFFVISDSRSFLEMIHGAPGQTCFAGKILCCISLLTFVWPIPSSKLAPCIVNSSRSRLSPSWYTGI